MLIGDSAFPPATYPTTFQGQPVVGWCVYIPGGDAYHGWSQAEIDHLKKQPWCRYILPVFVRSHPRGAQQAAGDAATVAAWAHAQGQPRGTLTMWDAETAIDTAYELTLDKDLRAETGDLEITYGSKSTVIRMPTPSGGDDEALWTGTIPGALTSMAVQFYSGNEYDLNLFRSDAPLWDLRAAPITTTTAPSAQAPKEDDMDHVSVDGVTGFSWQQGSKHVVQVTYDGAIGPTPTLRVVLLYGAKTGKGATELYTAEKPFTAFTGGVGVIELPAGAIPDAAGVWLEELKAPSTVRYAAYAGTP